VDEFAGLRAAERCPNKTNVASRSESQDISQDKDDQEMSLRGSI